MLPCVDCTSTKVFEQGYLFLTPQLKYGSGKEICPAVTQILCTITKFHHCLAASKAHHFYISSSSPTKHHTSFLEPNNCFLCWYLMTQNTPKWKGQHTIFQKLLDREVWFQQGFPRQPRGLSGEDKFVWNGHLYSYVHTGVHGHYIWHQVLCIVHHLPSGTMKINSSISVKSHPPHAPALYKAIHMPSDSCYFDTAPHDELRG